MSLKTITLSVLSACFVSAMNAQDATATGTEGEVVEAVADTAAALTVSENSLGKIRPEGKAWYLEVSAGWGMPFLPTNRRSPLAEIGDKDWYQRGQRELSVKPLFGTNGGGWAANISVGHMFNKNIGIDGTFTFAQHPEQLDARIDILGYYATQKTSTNAIYFAPHLVMKANKGKFGVTGKAGLFIPIFGNTISNADIRDRSGRMMQTLMGLPIQPLAGGVLDLTFKAKTLTTYSPTVGVSTSVSFDYLLTDKLTIFAHVRVGAYTISLKETTFDELYMSTKLLGIEIQELGQLKTKINSVDEAPEFFRKIIYRKEITTESNTARYGGRVDLNKPMEEVGQKYNASSMYFNLGVTYSFDRWAKRSAKKAEKSASKK